jgi:hypothetical protein
MIYIAGSRGDFQCRPGDSISRKLCLFFFILFGVERGGNLKDDANTSWTGVPGNRSGPLRNTQPRYRDENLDVTAEFRNITATIDLLRPIVKVDQNQ